MFNFKTPTLEDRAWMQPILSSSESMGCENAFGSFYLWCGAYHTLVCREGGCLLRCSGWGAPAYGLPLGGADPFDMVEKLMRFAESRGEPFRMWGLTKEETGAMEKRFPGRFQYRLDRAGSDYIYRTQDLIALAGRKYHGKRNHIAQFERAYSWSYEDVSRENLRECMAVAEIWRKENAALEGVEHEEEAIRKAFEAFGELQFCGGLIRVEGEPAAFAIGEESHPDLFVVHFEKALSKWHGLYAVINREFAARRLAGYEYVNREEDLGIEGLRRAKLSYRPAFLLEKYLAEPYPDETGREVPV